MHVERLRLTDFRNYHALDLVLPRGLVVFYGRNAQGKSNVLEAVSLMATSRSFRTNAEREVVRWHAVGHFARVDATVARRADTLHIELVIADSAPAGPASADTRAQAPTVPGVPFRKRIRVNGTPRRAMDLLGQVTLVVFAPTHLDLVIGPPSERRRFMDLTLCQVHPPYCRALSQYQKVLVQRGALLRRIREGEESAHALPYWDEQLAALAVPIVRARAAFVARAELPAGALYGTLAREDAASGANDALDAADAPPGDTPTAADGPRVEAALQAEGDLRAALDVPLRLHYRPSYSGPLDEDDATIAEDFRARLLELRRREIAQGANVLGPHRDDLAFYAGDVDLAVYGSRGQQRSVALALKLAELAYIEAETGDQPILLLDDVLSELDGQRRADLLDAVRSLDQVLLTVTDLTSLPEDARARAHLFAVRAGRVLRAAPGQPGAIHGAPS